jgi:hypothetical protein
MSHPVRKAPMLCVLLCAALAAAAPGAAAELAVYPAEVRLDHARDAQRLIAVVRHDDGTSEDLTQSAAITVAPEALAVWNAETGRLEPRQDGEGVIQVRAADTTVDVPLRVANVAVDPVVSFRNDVLPIFTQAGCNAGACHGAADGQNGFMLSLFAYDPDHDYLSVTREARARRMNPAKPEESLFLKKGAGQVDHEGGTVLNPNGPFYETLKRWVAEGANDDPDDMPKAESIEVWPREAVLKGADATQQLLVLANYSDGTTRDVTDLSILSSSDEQSLTVDASGAMTAGDPGEVMVMARFDVFAEVSQVIVVPGELEYTWPDTPELTYVDAHVFEKLRKLRALPAARSADEVFIRRVYLDILGVLPTIEETRQFLDDTNPGKRAELIEALLYRPEFTRVWAMKWADWLQVRTTAQLDAKGMHRYNDWLREAIATNMPLDEMVNTLLSAEGGNFAEPAANFYLNERDPAILAENVAQVFMGVQIQCAQCHDHPFDRWTMDDYYSFAAFFAQIGRKSSTDPRETVIFNRGSGEVRNLRDDQQMAPRFLGGAMAETQGRDRRVVLAEWLTAPDNPYFARNIANRVWAHFFGTGIVDPPDDVRVSNPPSHPALLDELAERLAASDYDLRGLVRDICNSYTYQMAAEPAPGAANHARNFAYAQIRRLDAEPLLDAICQVTDTHVKFPNLPLGARAVEVAAGESGNHFLELFGRPPRESVCTCERRNEPTLAQALHLLNSDTIDSAIRAPEGRLARLLEQESEPDVIVEELYLAALARPPHGPERDVALEYVSGAEDPKAAWEDVLWTLLNSKAFVFNH